MMMTEQALERCKSFIDCQIKATRGSAAGARRAVERPMVTISRQTGSGARTTAGHLASYLNEHLPPAHCSWTVFDRNLVEKVLEDHHLPNHLARFMTEEKTSEIDHAVREMLGGQPSLWDLVHYTAETILRLAHLGNVILVGRGAVVITRGLSNAFHVRLVASLEKRILRTRENYSLTQHEATEFVRKEDHQRERYLQKVFGKEIEDPLLYHLTINTDLVPCEEAAGMIGQAVIRRAQP
jgi:cytidylate kinase